MSDPDSIFTFDPFVGGRYSLWLAIGLSLNLAIGNDHFKALLDGAHALDRHLEQKIPVILVLLDIWNQNFLGAQNLAIVPYAQNLEYLPIIGSFNSR